MIVLCLYLHYIQAKHLLFIRKLSKEYCDKGTKENKLNLFENQRQVHMNEQEKQQQ